jgi:hypothetical protein
MNPLNKIRELFHQAALDTAVSRGLPAETAGAGPLDDTEVPDGLARDVSMRLGFVAPTPERLEQVKTAVRSLPPGMITAAQLESVGVSEAEFDAVADADIDAEAEDHNQRREESIASFAESMTLARARELLADERERRAHASGCHLDAGTCPTCSVDESVSFESAEYDELNLRAARRVRAQHPNVAADSGTDGTGIAAQSAANGAASVPTQDRHGGTDLNSASGVDLAQLSDAAPATSAEPSNLQTPRGTGPGRGVSMRGGFVAPAVVISHGQDPVAAALDSARAAADRIRASRIELDTDHYEHTDSAMDDTTVQGRDDRAAGW